MNAEQISGGQVIGSQNSVQIGAGQIGAGRAGSVDTAETRAYASDVSEQDYRELIGKRLRASRIWRQLSQDEVAIRAGIERNFVSAIERGVRSLDAYRLRRIAMVLGIDLADLLTTDGSWQP